MHIYFRRGFEKIAMTIPTVKPIKTAKTFKDVSKDVNNWISANPRPTTAGDPDYKYWLDTPTKGSNWKRSKSA